ncbi:hypothetical protein FM106_21340 [Brachybacterium faecium]|nr:hypothetical protein FM106_21340 [Brachybacterium faecium]
MTLDECADVWDPDLDAVAGSLDVARKAAADAHEVTPDRVAPGSTGKSSGVVPALHR